MLGLAIYDFKRKNINKKISPSRFKGWTYDSKGKHIKTKSLNHDSRAVLLIAVVACPNSDCGHSLSGVQYSTCNRKSVLAHACRAYCPAERSCHECSCCDSCQHQHQHSLCEPAPTPSPGPACIDTCCCIFCQHQRQHQHSTF